MTRGRIGRISGAALLCGLAVGATVADERVALVVGNAGYQHVARLANPANDARDIATALESLGFSVNRIDDSDKKALERGLQEFRKRASQADVAVVYYAGHGIEVDGRNFLLPVDAKLASDGDVEYEAVSLELVTRAVAARQFGIVFLDACRDNPFLAKMRSAGISRSIGRGLSRVEPRGDTVVAYAARAGTMAADGDGRNSPYAAALLGHLAEPGVDVGMLLRKVGATVREATGDDQQPVYYGNLPDRLVYLAPGPPRPGVAAPLDPETEAWQRVSAAADPDMLQGFLSDWPTGRYVAAARALLARLLPSFAVRTVPSNAKVRFLGVATRYSSGMALRPGHYRLEVSAEGFTAKVVDVHHRESPTRLDVTLEALRNWEQWCDGIYESCQKLTDRLEGGERVSRHQVPGGTVLHLGLLRFEYLECKTQDYSTVWRESGDAVDKTERLVRRQNQLQALLDRLSVLDPNWDETHGWLTCIDDSLSSLLDAVYDACLDRAPPSFLSRCEG